MPDAEARQSVEALEAAGSARPGSARANATLLIHVVDKTKGVPLPRIRVTLTVKHHERPIPLEQVDGSKGKLGQMLRTGGKGEAEFEAPVGVELFVQARDESGEAGFARQDIAALTAGERREITLALPTGPDLRFCCRVVARESGRPIAGAKLRSMRASGPKPERSGAQERPGDLVTGVDGRAETELTSWRRGCFRVEADGYGLALVVPAHGHETSDTAALIVLDRAATLAAHVVDASGSGIAGARIVLKTNSWEVERPETSMAITDLPDPTWNATTDSDGRCAIEGLPPGAAISAEVAASAGGKWKPYESLILLAGETRDVEWKIGGGARLTGRALDQDEQPVAAMKLWILPAEAGGQPYLSDYAEKDVVAKAVTDAQGRFAFDDIAAGSWWLSPAPTRDYWQPAVDDAVAPFAIVVEIPADAPQAEQDIRVSVGLYIRVSVGLYIRGSVLDPEEQPVNEAVVYASSEEGDWLVIAQSKKDGSFAAGPLVSGSYKLNADGNAPHSDSDSVRATAGDEGIILRLLPGGALAGQVIDGASGAGCRASVTLCPQEPRQFWLMTSDSDREGSFRFDGLSPGAYSLSARTDNGKAGVLLGVQVVAKRDADGLVLTMQPGAALRVRYEGSARWAHFTIRHQGVAVASDGLQTGTSSLQVVPAGKVEVELGITGREAKTKEEVELAVGEEKEVVFRNDE